MKSIDYKIVIALIAIFIAILNVPYANAAFDFKFDLENLRNQNTLLTKSYDIIDIQKTWERILQSTLTLSPIIVGIVDTGVDAGHQEFNSPKVNFGTATAAALIDLFNGGHGTQVTGIIGANNVLGSGGVLSADSPQMNGILAGALKESQYKLEIENYLRINNGKSIGVYAALERVLEKKPNIVNMSFGMPTCSSIPSFRRELLKLKECYKTDLDFLAAFNQFLKVFNIEENKDVLFVASAGNWDVDSAVTLPAAIKLPNIITVGATDLNDGRATFVPLIGEKSNFGSNVDISAPGLSVYAPKPDNIYENPMGIEKRFKGTSASAPMVTGVAGLIKAIKPGLTPAQVKNILTKTENTDPVITDPGKPIGRRLNALKSVCDPLVLNCAPPPPPTVPAAWPMLQKNAQHTGLADVAGPPFATSTAVNIKWQKPLGLLTDFPILVDRGKIYVGAGFNLLAFDAINGNQIWQTNIPAGATNGAVGPDGTIYVCGLNSNLQSILTAVDADSHQVKWQFNVGFFRPCNSPVVDKNGVIYTSVPPAFNTQLAAAVAVNPDGTQKWRYEEGNIATTPPALSSDESQVYVVFFNRLLAFNSATGQIVWTQNLPVLAGFPNLPVVDKEERILILNPSDFGSFLTAFSKSGAVLWQKSSNAIFISLYPGGKIAAVSLSDLSLINSSDGMKIPNSTISLPANSILVGVVPPAVDVNGLVYVPLKLSDISAGLAVLDANGLRWTFSTPAIGFTAIGGSAIFDNRLYFSIQGILFSFGQ